MTPMDWWYITGLQFTGDRVPLEVGIHPTAVCTLLGFSPQEWAFKAYSICSGPLSVDAAQGSLQESLPKDLVERNRIL